jgi:hypothetical protein
MWLLAGMRDACFTRKHAAYYMQVFRSRCTVPFGLQSSAIGVGLVFLHACETLFVFQHPSLYSHILTSLHTQGLTCELTSLLTHFCALSDNLMLLVPFTGGPITRRFFAPHPTVLQVGSTLFVHGGVLPSHVEYGLERINRETRDWLMGKPPGSSGGGGSSSSSSSGKRLPPPEFLRGADAVVWARWAKIGCVRILCFVAAAATH